MTHLFKFRERDKKLIDEKRKMKMLLEEKVQEEEIKRQLRKEKVKYGKSNEIWSWIIIF